MTTAERLTAIKKYCRVDYDEDDTQLTGFAEMSDSYLAQCGITRDGHEAMYDLIVQAMVLNQYDGKCADNAAAALADKEIGIVLLTEKFGREFPDVVNQLKLVCAFGGADDGNTGS